MDRNQLADRLNQIAARELDSVKKLLATFKFPEQIVLLIEICRAMDYQHVLQILSKNPQNKLPVPDFDIMSRGWNPALGLLLPHVAGFKGMPVMESTTRSRAGALTFLHQLGRSVLLSESADMIRHGMADGEVVDDRIVLRMSERVAIDHFLDRLETAKLRRLEREMDKSDPYERLVENTEVANFDERMTALLFPWDSGHGTMIGYGAEPDIDHHYLARVAKATVDWRDQAGIPPESQISGVPGADLAAVGMLLTSTYLKHIRFVDLGWKKIPKANYAMSLTIWKPGDELAESMSEFTGMSKDAIAAALDLFTVKREDHAFFERERTPFVPMLIEVSDGYLLSPISSIFRNVFQGIRMLQERRPSYAEAAVREPRENWMIVELCHLFLGNRYIIIDTPTRLKRDGRTVTDIDAAVLDRTTSTLALFQLKWQDFSSNEVRTQRSRAKNFVDRVDAWAFAVEGWVEEFGKERLCDVLRLPRHHGEQLAEIRLFAVGRTAARFQSYGYVQKCGNIAVCNWPQFVRLRYEVGPAENVFQSLHAAVQTEDAVPVVRRPLRHEIVAAGQQIVFEDLWSLYDDGDDGEAED